MNEFRHNSFISSTIAEFKCKISFSLHFQIGTMQIQPDCLCVRRKPKRNARRNDRWDYIKWIKRSIRHLNRTKIESDQYFAGTNNISSTTEAKSTEVDTKIHKLPIFFSRAIVAFPRNCSLAGQIT